MSYKNPSRKQPPRLSTPVRLGVAAVAACFLSAPVLSNPLNPTVVNGIASFNQAGKVLTVTNSPGAIINWQKFSIQAGETTHFAQTAASSTVLNRVLNDPTAIYGTLSSNGRVWLVNPAGIMVGPGGKVDVAGFVASTLNISNADFLAGRNVFINDGSAGNVINQGEIRTPAGGSVYLIGSNVSNEGLITTPQGETILAAGATVSLVDSATPGVKVDITGTEGNATNLGTLTAEAGRIGIAGVIVRNSGTVNASSVVSEGGRVFLKASQDAYVDGNGRIVTTGTKGGSVEVLGNRVAVMGNASIDASATSEGGDGGKILVGGDYQGKNPEIQNASVSYFGPDASLKADAGKVGAGGTVIVWADDTTRAYGNISARGGVAGGDGGFVETSGHRYLDIAGARVDTRAPSGQTGNWLLDPVDVTIMQYGGSPTSGSAPFAPTINASVIYGEDITAALGTTGVTIQTDGGSGGVGNITATGVNVYGGGNALSLLAYGGSTAYGNIDISGSSFQLGSGALTLVAGWSGAGTGLAGTDGTDGSIKITDSWLHAGPVVMKAVGDISAIGVNIGSGVESQGTMDLQANNIYLTGGSNFGLNPFNPEAGAGVLIKSVGSQTVTAAGSIVIQAGSADNIYGGSSPYYGGSAGFSSDADQTISANVIRVLAGVGGHDNQAGIEAYGGQTINITGTGGLLEVKGGGNAGSFNNQARVQHGRWTGPNTYEGVDDQTVNIYGGGSVVIAAGSGTGTNGYFDFDDCGSACAGTSSSNSAEIENLIGSQTLNFTSYGSLTITGGSAGTNNWAEIENSGTGDQVINGSPNITLNGGSAGGSAVFYGGEYFEQTNDAGIYSEGGSDQYIFAGTLLIDGGNATYGGAGISNEDMTGTLTIVTTGDMSMYGGTSSAAHPYAAPVYIHSETGAPIILDVGGNLYVKAGSGGSAPAIIGSVDGSANVEITTGGNVTIIADGSGAAIGSMSATYGATVNINSGGSLSVSGSATRGVLIGGMSDPGVGAIPNNGIAVTTGSVLTAKSNLSLLSQADIYLATGVPVTTTYGGSILLSAVNTVYGGGANLNTTPLTPGANAGDISVYGSSITLGSLIASGANGVNGANGSNGDDGGNGVSGGNAGKIALRATGGAITVTGALTANGGYGGDAGDGGNSGGIGGNGGTGGTGGTVTLDASGLISVTGLIQANGGNAGSGGRGGNGSDGGSPAGANGGNAGNGGLGGNVTLTAGGNINLSALSARGGRGSDGGRGGSASSSYGGGIGGNAGNGGNGGTLTMTAGGKIAVTGLIDVIGGSGGSGGDGGNATSLGGIGGAAGTGGFGGAGGNITLAAGSTASDAIHVGTIHAYGSSGGSGGTGGDGGLTGGNGGHSGNGGNGGTVQLTASAGGVRIDTSIDLYGGEGGSEGSGGSGGLTGTGPNARGGNAANGGHGGHGGTLRITAGFAGPEAIKVTSIDANGGSGGHASSGGSGGSYGGRGGNGGNGGNGGSVTLTATAGGVVVSAISAAGGSGSGGSGGGDGGFQGGDAGNGGAGGNGGSISVSAATDISISNIDASGGSGGHLHSAGNGGDFGGNGGIAGSGGNGGSVILSAGGTISVATGIVANGGDGSSGSSGGSGEVQGGRGGQGGNGGNGGLIRLTANTITVATGGVSANGGDGSSGDTGGNGIGSGVGGIGGNGGNGGHGGSVTLTANNSISVIGGVSAAGGRGDSGGSGGSASNGVSGNGGLGGSGGNGGTVSLTAGTTIAVSGNVTAAGGSGDDGGQGGGNTFSFSPVAGGNGGLGGKGGNGGTVSLTAGTAIAVSSQISARGGGGGGGGGGGSGSSADYVGQVGGKGGNGGAGGNGGSVVLRAAQMDATVASFISVDGGEGGWGGDGGFASEGLPGNGGNGANGGAGGSITLTANSVPVSGLPFLSARGGSGGSGGSGNSGSGVFYSNGGHGGNGNAGGTVTLTGTAGIALTGTGQINVRGGSGGDGGSGGTDGTGGVGGNGGQGGNGGGVFLGTPGTVTLTGGIPFIDATGGFGGSDGSGSVSGIAGVGGFAGSTIFSAGGNMDVGAISSTSIGSLALVAGGTLNLTNDIDIDGSLILSGANVLAAGPIEVGASLNTFVTAGTLNLSNGAGIYAGFNMLVNTGGEINLSNGGWLGAGNDVNLTGSAIKVDGGSVFAYSNIIGKVLENITLDNGGYFEAGDDIKLLLAGSNSEVSLSNGSYMLADSVTLVPQTIFLDFLTRSSGGVMIDGTATTTALPGGSGFFVMDTNTPATTTPGGGLVITYANSIVVDPCASSPDLCNPPTPIDPIIEVVEADPCATAPDSAQCKALKQDEEDKEEETFGDKDEDGKKDEKSSQKKVAQCSV